MCLMLRRSACSGGNHSHLCVCELVVLVLERFYDLCDAVEAVGVDQELQKVCHLLSEVVFFCHRVDYLLALLCLQNLVYALSTCAKLSSQNTRSADVLHRPVHGHDAQASERERALRTCAAWPGTCAKPRVRWDFGPYKRRRQRVLASERTCKGLRRNSRNSFGSTSLLPS